MNRMIVGEEAILAGLIGTMTLMIGVAIGMWLTSSPTSIKPAKGKYITVDKKSERFYVLIDKKKYYMYGPSSKWVKEE